MVLLSLRDGKETPEIRYFISSPAMGMTRFARAVRSHWGIEDREDESRMRDDRLRENILAETRSEQRQPYHETPRLRLEPRFPGGSPDQKSQFVCAGPGDQLKPNRNHESPNPHKWTGARQRS